MSLLPAILLVSVYKSGMQPCINEQHILFNTRFPVFLLFFVLQSFTIGFENDLEFLHTFQ